MCGSLMGNARTHKRFLQASLLNSVIGATIKVVFDEVKPC